MSDLHIPHNIFGYLMGALAREEATELAESFQESGLAHPSERFGEVFAWCWEEDRDTAMHLLTQLLLAAQQQCEPGEEITLEKLLDDLRYGLHRTKLGRDYEYQAIRDYAEVEVPGLMASDD